MTIYTANPNLFKITYKCRSLIFKRPTRTQLFLKLHKHTKMANQAQFVKIVHL